MDASHDREAVTGGHDNPSHVPGGRMRVRDLASVFRRGSSATAPGEAWLDLGRLPPGPHNAITDVPGVLVGHSTIVRGHGPLVVGEGPVRTGVTAVLPHGDNLFTEKVPAAVHVINGFGKAMGLIQVMECGVLETPILLTNTLNVGRVADALIDHMLADTPDIGITTGTVNPMVAECNDGYLNDIQGRHVGPEHVAQALADAKLGRAAVAEGAIGAGTGMSAFGWKGGIGTSSRLIAVPGAKTGVNRYVLGALVLTNFGTAHDLVIGGWPVGRYLPPPDGATNRPGRDTNRPHHDTNQPGNETNRTGEDTNRTGNHGLDSGDGSVVIVLATNAPLDGRQLRRVAQRAVVGIVRCGGRLSHGSGDFVIAFSTAYRIPHAFAASGSLSPTAIPPVSSVYDVSPWPDDGPVMADLLRASGEATEEAVLNSLFQAHTVVGRDGHVRHALPVEAVAELIESWVRPRA